MPRGARREGSSEIGAQLLRVHCWLASWLAEPSKRPLPVLFPDSNGGCCFRWLTTSCLTQAAGSGCSTNSHPSQAYFSPLHLTLPWGSSPHLHGWQFCDPKTMMLWASDSPSGQAPEPPASLDFYFHRDSWFLKHSLCAVSAAGKEMACSTPAPALLCFSGNERP